MNKLMSFAAALVLLFVAGASPTLGRPNKPLAIPCGTRADLYLQSFARTGQTSVNIQFDALGGGTVWSVVPPNWQGTSIPNDQTSRHYSVTVPVRADGPSPIPVQVQGISDAQPCSTGLTVTNVVVNITRVSDGVDN